MQLDEAQLELDCKKLENVIAGTTSAEEAASILWRWDGVIPNGAEKIVSMRSYLKFKSNDEQGRHYFRVDAHGLRELGRRYFAAQAGTAQ